MENSKISAAEKLKTAVQYKTEGNVLYKDKNYRGAAGKYHRALLFLKAIDADSDSVTRFRALQGPAVDVPENIKSEALQLKVDCYNNLAASLLQQRNADFHKIVTYCQFVLEVQPGNEKALFRKGQALYQQKDFDAALEAFNCVSKDAAARKYAEMCRTELAKQSANEKAMYQSVFSKLSNS